MQRQEHHMQRQGKQKWFVNQLLDAISLIDRKKHKLKNGAISYLIAIAKFADKEGNAWPLARQISAITGQSDAHFFRYDAILKSKKIFTIKKRYDRRNRMTRKYFKIDIQAVLNLSMDENGSLKIEEITVKDDCLNSERLSKLENDRLSKLENATIKTTQATKPPMRASLEIVQEKHLDDSVMPNTIVDMPFDYYFEEFWSAYPRKEKKLDAHGIWIKKKLDKLASEIIDDVRLRQIKHLPWQQGRLFIPLPTSYLNGKRWKDEIISDDEKEIQDGKSKSNKYTESQQATNRAREEYLRSISGK